MKTVMAPVMRWNTMLTSLLASVCQSVSAVVMLHRKEIGNCWSTPAGETNGDDVNCPRAHTGNTFCWDTLNWFSALH